MNKHITAMVIIMGLLCGVLIIFHNDINLNPLDSSPPLHIDSHLVAYETLELTPITTSVPTLTPVRQSIYYNNSKYETITTITPEPTKNNPDDKSEYRDTPLISLDETQSSFVLGHGQLKVTDPMSYIYYEQSQGSRLLKTHPDDETIKIVRDSTKPYITQKTEILDVGGTWVCPGTWRRTGVAGQCMNTILKYTLHVPSDTIIKHYLITPEQVIRDGEKK